MFQYVCDKCGKTSDPQKGSHMPDTWRVISYAAKGYGYTDTLLHLCPDCVVVLKIPESKDESLGDRLIDILSEIAQEVVDDQN